MEIEPIPGENGIGSIRFVDAEKLWTFPFWPRDWLDRATKLLGGETPINPTAYAVALRLPVVEAHTQAERDLFITSEPHFLKLRSRIPEANICDLGDGLRIIGLYLRSLGDYTFRASRKFKQQFTSDLFYWVL